jgi:hypothetical protein
VGRDVRLCAKKRRLGHAYAVIGSVGEGEDGVGSASREHGSKVGLTLKNDARVRR